MFSIVVPLYNKELSVSKTIDSVLKQTYQDFEIIIVNDGSTDNGLSVVESISNDKIKIINQKNKGVSIARNTGIDNSSYDWILFLDADDEWNPNHLEVMCSLISKFSGYYFFATSFIYSDLRRVDIYKKNREDYLVEDYFQVMLSQHLVWTSVVMINKIVIDKCGYFNGNLVLGEDLEYWARIAREFKLVKSNVITATYCLDAENRSDKISHKYEKTIFSTIDLSNIQNVNEFKYFKKVLLNRLKISVIKFELSVFYKIVRKNGLYIFGKKITNSIY